MNYLDQVANRIWNICEPEDAWGRPDQEQDRLLYRIYAVLVLAKGTETTSKDVHDAWSAWTIPVMPEHRSLVPFDQLTEDVQRMDDYYRDAIHAVARSLR